jgi:hypothetical protein
MVLSCLGAYLFAGDEERLWLRHIPREMAPTSTLRLTD